MSKRWQGGMRIALAGLALAVLAAGVWWAARPAPELIQGQVEVRQVSVSSKIPGRIDSVLVREGDRLTAGQPVAVLRSPEIEAKARQADASVEAARAQRAKARSGARAEEVRAARAQWERAEEAARLAATTMERIQALYEEGVVAEQKRDEAATRLRTSRSAAEAARAAYEMAESGARAEDRDAAGALVRQAEGGRAEVQAYLDETRLYAPLSGEVVERVVEPGELVGPGMPVVAVVDLTDAWVTFSLREDRLAGLRVGTPFQVVVPALGDRTVDLTVSYIAAMGDFATWRSTRQSGGFDLRTFEVRARPDGPVEGLRPGMSVLLPADALRER
jgi:HlyD family secretion protein